METAGNIFWLGLKQLRSFFKDYVLLALVFYAFSLAIVMQARSNSQELFNASIAVVDEDQSVLSRRIAGAFLQPLVSTGKICRGARPDAVDELRRLHLRCRYPAEF